MNCVVLQPSYIPWRGFFHQIQKADVFVWYDDVQYDKHGWRNRNRIKTPSGAQWLTIPVIAKGVVENHVPINQIRVNPNEDWGRKHWQTLKQHYGKAPYFARYAPMLEDFYCSPVELLADFTIATAEWIARELGISHTRFVRSSSLLAEGTKTDRLVSLFRQVGATHYISGPSAREYMQEEKLAAAGVTLEWMTYDYPEYEQLYPPYDPQISILDLLFMKGPDAPKFIWG